jgi:hypothetical protein
MVIDPHNSFSDYRNYKHISEAHRELRQNVRRLAEQWSSFDSIKDLEQIDPWFVEFNRGLGGKAHSVTVTILKGGGLTYEIDLPRGTVRGMDAGEQENASIRNSRGNQWMFEYYLNKYGP